MNNYFLTQRLPPALIQFYSALLFAFMAVVAPANAAPDVTPVSLSEREKAATQMLQLQETNADYWEYGWGAFDAGTMAWSAIAASNEQGRRARKADIVQAAESLIGLADVMFRPLPAFNAGSVCDDSSAQQNRLQCLAAKEALLERSAERANEPYEWMPHLGNAAFNLAAGLLVWRLSGTGRALVTAIPGELIGELQLWTIPGQPLADYEQYKMRFSPLLIQTAGSKSPTTGVMASFKF